MIWTKLEDRLPPVGIKVLAYFNHDEFVGYAVVSRKMIRKMSGLVVAYKFETPSGDCDEIMNPERWCLIEDEPEKRE